MIRSMLRGGIAPAAVVVFVASADAAFNVSVNLEFQLRSTNGSIGYAIDPFVSGGGFTDPVDPGNNILVSSPNALYTGTPTTGGLTILPTFDDVVAEATAGAWTIEVTDGATAEVRTFEFLVDVSSTFTQDYFRAASPVGFAPAGFLPTTPTFEWTIEPALIPEAEFDYSVASIQGAAFEFGPDDVSATSYTPSISPLAPGGGYQFLLFLRNFSNFEPGIVTFSDALATDGGEELDSFGSANFVGSVLQVSDLTVVPAPGTLALAGAAGLVATRRRR
jgi:hypothetical protein